MILKILGILLVMLSSTLTGLYFANRDSYRMKDLAQMKKAFIILKSEIEYTLTPIPQAMKNISEKIDPPVSDIFLNFEKILLENKREGLHKIWAVTLEENSRECYFEPEDMACFLSFGKSLGYLDRQMQMNNIDLTIAYIEERVAFLTQESAKNKKLYHSLGILSGLVICILLV